MLVVNPRHVRIGRRTNLVRGAAALAVVIAAIELMSFLPAAAASSSVRSPTPPTVSIVSAGGEAGVGASQLAAAQDSLEAGRGPDGGAKLDCSGDSASSGSVTCNAPPASGPIPPPTTTSPSWTELTYPIPAARVGATMVYDAKDKYVLLFGGYGPAYPGAVMSTTWKFTGGVWTKLSPSTSPPARQLAAMAYDAKDAYVVLYGGLGASALLSDTWKFVGGAWTQLHPTTNPGAIDGATMAYDTKDGYVVLFGGSASSGLVKSFTWEFVGGQWTKSAPSPAPPGREYASMDYDATDGYVVLFGGDNSTTSTILGDTWTYTAGAWTKLAPTTSPPARDLSGMAYSALDSEIVIFGGAGSTGSFLSDTWTFVAGQWTKIATAAHPSKRDEFSMADGTSTTDVLLFGGTSPTAFLNDNWTFHGLIWAKSIPRVPSGRDYEAMAYDEADGYVLLFGGELSAFLGDTWKFAHGIWTPLHPAISPSPRIDASMTYDQADGYVVLFGGLNSSGELDDTWTYVGGVWTELPGLTLAGNAGYPVGRAEAAMTYDYADGYVLMFGGFNGSHTPNALSDTWTFSGGVWTELFVSTSPSGRLTDQITYDSEDGYVLLFSGDSNYYADTWSYLAGTWTNLTSSMSASPPGTISGGLVDDTYDGYPLLWGGETQGGYTTATWEFTGSGWTQLSPATSPPAASAGSVGIAFDPPDKEVVLYVYYTETWTY
jgi:hypothetical protein